MMTSLNSQGGHFYEVPMANEYRHTDFPAMMSRAESYSASEMITKATFGVILTIFWAGLCFMGVVWHTLGVFPWMSVLAMLPLLVYVVTSGMSWLRCRQTLLMSKKTLYLAFDDLRNAEFYSEAQIALWEVSLFSLYGEDKVKITPVLDHTQESLEHL